MGHRFSNSSIKKTASQGAASATGCARSNIANQTSRFARSGRNSFYSSCKCCD